MIDFIRRHEGWFILLAIVLSVTSLVLKALGL